MLIMKARFAGAAMAMAVGLAGCGADTYPHVPVDSLAATLSTDIATMAPDVVKVSTTIVAKDGSESGSYGSGMRVSPTEIVSAAHVVAGRIGCDGTYVDVPTAKRKDYGNGQYFYGTDVRTDMMHIGTEQQFDAATIHVSAEQATTMDPLVPVAFRNVATDPIKPGEALYILGYGARDLKHPSERDERNPYEGKLYPDKVEKGYTHPWIIGAVALSSDAHHRMFLLTGLHDYSEGARRTEAAANEGDSGGPVFDGKGRYVGDLIRGDSKLSLGDIENMTHVAPTNLPKNYNPSLAEMELVSPADISRLDSMRQAHCVMEK